MSPVMIVKYQQTSPHPVSWLIRVMQIRLPRGVSPLSWLLMFDNKVVSKLLRCILLIVGYCILQITTEEFDAEFEKKEVSWIYIYPDLYFTFSSIFIINKYIYKIQICHLFICTEPIVSLWISWWILRTWSGTGLHGSINYNVFKCEFQSDSSVARMNISRILICFR